MISLDCVRLVLGANNFPLRFRFSEVISRKAAVQKLGELASYEGGGADSFASFWMMSSPSKSVLDFTKAAQIEAWVTWSYHRLDSNLDF